MKEISFNTNEIDWEVAKEYPAGAMKKVLLESSESVLQSFLLKIEPGWKMEEHSHVYTELHYVLEGEVWSGDKVFPAGSFRIIPKQTNHGPFTTNKSAVILVVWIRESSPL